MKNRSFLIVLVFAAIALMAADLMPPVSGGSAGIVPVRESQKTTMFAKVTILSLSQGDSTFLTASLAIVTEAGKPVVGASALLRWTLPDGTTIFRLAATDKDGLATFNILAMQGGKYSFETVRVYKDGYAFDHSKGNCSADYLQ